VQRGFWLASTAVIQILDFLKSVLGIAAFGPLSPKSCGFAAATWLGATGIGHMYAVRFPELAAVSAVLSIRLFVRCQRSWRGIEDIAAIFDTWFDRDIICLDCAFAPVLRLALRATLLLVYGSGGLFGIYIVHRK
jgi:hypothetical protein